MNEEILIKINELKKLVSKLDIVTKIDTLNQIKLTMHEISPFKKEPVDCVIWVQNHQVQSNDYNPNSVAPPEMKLLEISIEEDGYTQPIVSWNIESGYEVIDGFHRNRVGKECAKITKRVHGYLPLVVINQDRIDKGDRIASTIRHNRARGKHKVNAMSEIVLDLKRRNWKDEKIARELGMDPDEVLRLAQITGLTEMFKDREFSKSWIIDSIDETDTLQDNNEIDQ